MSKQINKVEFFISTVQQYECYQNYAWRQNGTLRLEHCTTTSSNWAFEIRYYGLLFACGFLVGYQIMQKIFIHEGRDPEDLSSLLTHLMLGTIIGARLGHCLFYEPAYYLSHPLQILMVWKGGLASHGGGIGVITAVFLYCRKHADQPFLWLSDRIYIGLMFTGFCIRLGNFFNSEIVGLPSNVSWAVVFERIDSIPRHPAQLYESIAYLVGFIFMCLLYMKQKKRRLKESY